MPYLSSTVTHIVGVDYWRNMHEMCVTGRSRSLKIVPFESFGMFFYSHSIATTALSFIILDKAINWWKIAILSQRYYVRYITFALCRRNSVCLLGK